MQIDLFNIIRDVTKQEFCEICKQPSNNIVCGDGCLKQLRTIINEWTKQKQNEINRKD